MSYAMLYLNGKFLGGWPYGYTRWAQAIIRAVPGATGTIRVTVRAEGLVPATETIGILAK